MSTPLPLPTISHLQFLVLDLLVTTREQSAQQLQTALTTAGQEQHGPKFYQLMKRLQQAGYVEVCQKGIAIAGGQIRRTFYQLTDAGRAAWHSTLAFYATRLELRKNILQST